MSSRVKNLELHKMYVVGNAISFTRKFETLTSIAVTDKYNILYDHYEMTGSSKQSKSKAQTNIEEEYHSLPEMFWVTFLFFS